MTIPLFDIPVWFIAKIFMLFALALYIVFALVVVKQVNLMTETIEVGFETPLKVIAYVHLFFSIGVFVLALLIL